MKIKDCCKFEPKCKIKAGEACPNGKYLFFTSSQIPQKINKITFDGEYLIMGTGGSASLHYCNEKFSTSSDCYVLKPNPSIKAKYLYYILKSKIDILEKGFKGTGLKHTNKPYINSIDVGDIPSIDIQEKIVCILDEISQLIDIQKQKINYYNELIKAKFIEMFGDPVTNTNGYPEFSLSELGCFSRGKSKHRPRDDPILLGGPYPLIQTGDVANADLYIKKYTSTYSEFGLKQSKLWDSGTLCITIAANIAKTAILTFDACFPDSIVGFIANEKTNNIFIHYWFSFFQKIIEKQAPETAQKNINLGTLNNLYVAIPPIKKQNQFAEWINEIQNLIKIANERISFFEELYVAEMHKYNNYVDI